MASSSSVQGQNMAFTDGDRLSLENKESETFSWQDPADKTTSGDFFEQYVMLDGADSGSPTAGGESFHELIEAPDMAAFSPLVPPGLTLPPKKSSGSGSGGVITNHDACTTVTSGGSSSHGISAYATDFFQPPPPPPQQQNHQHRQVRTRPNMSHHHHHSVMDQRELSMGAYEMPGGGGGSISDSELLKLEGLELRSPRVHVPPTSASVPPSPHSQSNSPRKGGRLEAMVARIRNKASTTFQGKSRQQQQQPPKQPTPWADMIAPLISTAQMGPGPGPGPSRTAGMGRSMPYNLQINKPHLPLSPPLTGSIVDLSHQPSVMGGGTNNDTDNGMQFVNGFLDDPFFDPSGLLMPMPQITNGSNANNGGAGPNTPLHTPLLTNFTSSAGGEPSTPAIVWQLGPDGKTLWTSPSMPNVSRAAASSSFLVAPDGSADNWWDGPDAMDTDDMGADAAVFQQQPNLRTSNAAALNLAMQQPGGGFEYPLPPGAQDFAASGLMIHMPQPRAPAPAVLQHFYPGTTIPQNGEANGATDSNKLQQSSKRPKPRAPSSGARYHHHQPSGSMTSPRKTRTASGSGASGGRTTPSPSPTQGPDGNTNPNRRLHRRSASMNTLTNQAGPEGGLGPTNPAAIRKRRSWTGRRLGATEAAAAAAAVSVGSIPPVPSIPPSLQQQQQSQRANMARRVSSTSSLSSTTAGGQDSSSQHQITHPHPPPHPRFLRNNRSMPQLTLQLPDHSHTPRRHAKRGSKDTPHSARKHSSTSSTGASQPGDGANGGAGGGGDFGLGFVNFTPQDHNILMTGVAPSGSSKTKARREKEAAERQRKLSEAVVKAVVAAGGDVRKLEQEGIVLS